MVTHSAYQYLAISFVESLKISSHPKSIHFKRQSNKRFVTDQGAQPGMGKLIAIQYRMNGGRTESLMSNVLGHQVRQKVWQFHCISDIPLRKQ
jgi:hypothetical protein